MTMVERVAAAIGSGWLRAGSEPLDEMRWNALPDYMRLVLMGEARLAIAAMRDPTEEMVRAARIAIMEADDGCGETWDYWINGYGPAIDAAIDPSRS